MVKKSDWPADVVSLKRRKCPICGQPAVASRRPFCSGRCADIDLGRWLNGNYRIPTDDPPSDALVEDDDGGG